ncbi:MAG: GNAT family N-acetyltransferase [Candidatus Bathyarchaeia archaeon]|jgi:predicted N-acetyltransferase YhbS
MFQVKPMQVKDFAFATELANTMNWNMAVEDFAFMTSLEPEGCFVAFEDSDRVGIATCISFNTVGWFGNLIVEEKYRRKGAGRLLVKHAVNYLQSKGAKTIGLYAYPNLGSFYGSLGFEKEMDFSVLHAEDLGSVAGKTMPKIETKQISTIEEFDSRCFGGNRKKLLESILLEKGNLSYYFSRKNEVVGYVAATVYETMAWVGPLICEVGNVDGAVELLKAVLAKLTGKSVYLALPKNEFALLDMLFNIGFTEDFSLARMFLGEATAKNCIYLAESLERG